MKAQQILGLAGLLLAITACAGQGGPLAVSGADDRGAEDRGVDDSGAEEVAVLETRLGTMTLRFFEQEAPRTVANFKRLVREGFYDGKPFYRVVAGHVIQAGDGGENDQPKVPAEFGAHPHVVGAVGLARDEDPNSGNTEIYICLAPRPHLDGRYAIFGLLTSGFDVLAAIGAVEVDEQFDGEVAFHKPKTPILIDRATLETQPTDRP